uniref:Uncharacterized protein n=1 Tax=Oryza meridionalis TaxID=40149 RepID=A0A0E0ES79_9ORYZ
MAAMLKQEEQCAAAAAAAAATDHPPRASKLARPPRRGGRANGRQPRGRGSSSHSHRAAAPRPSQSQSQMRAMENVVILKRGDRFAPEIGAAVTVEAPAADQCGAAAAAEEHAEPVTADGQRVAPAKMEPVQCVTPTKMEQPVAAAASAEQCVSPAKSAEPAVAAEQCIVLAAAKIPRPVAVAAAGQRRAPATKPKTSRVLYGGPSFVIPPDPSELPIPVLLLESRGRRSAACA